jgi:hypothetical protein
MDGIQFVTEALKTFETVKPGIEGIIASGTLLSATTKGSVYVIKKGAQFISYLIKSGKKKPATKTKEKNTASTKKSSTNAQDDIQITKPDVAIVVDISRRALVDVARFLKSQKIDADIVLVTNDPSYDAQVKFLNPESEEEWNEITLEFKSLMNRIKRTSGGRRVHIFLSAPAPLVFAMGAVWGTVDEASVYHWEHNTYNKVIAISRKIR